MYSRSEVNPLNFQPKDEDINIITLSNGLKVYTFKVSPQKGKCDCKCHDGEVVWDGKHCSCGKSMGAMRTIKGKIQMGHSDPSLSWPLPYEENKNE